MASKIRNRALSVLRSRPTTVSSQHSPHGRRQREDVTADPPPPYGADLSVSSAEDALINGKEDIEEDAGTPTVVENYVRICPHENLSFSRFQRTRNLPGFKESFQGVHILGDASGAHPKMTTLSLPDWNHTHSCVFETSDGEEYFGVAKCCLQNGKVFGDYNGPQSGAVLRTDWIFWLHRLPEESVSVEGMRQIFDEHPFLCEHMNLPEWVTPKLLVRAVQCCRNNKDSVGMEVLQGSFFRKETCASCNTWFQHRIVLNNKSFQVTSKRYLGKAKSAKDPVWLSQCYRLRVNKGMQDLQLLDGL
ncbi:MAG: hypothetical protein Q9218_000053 [Villophora microphyllina]